MVSFFQIAISLLAYVATFSEQLYFGRSYLFTLFQSNFLTQQLLFRGSYFFRTAAVFSFFRTVTFSQELFFQNSFFFGAKILQSSHFLRIGGSLRQLLFATAFFLEELLRIKVSKKSYFFKAGTSTQHQPFQKSYVLEKTDF